MPVIPAHPTIIILLGLVLTIAAIVGYVADYLRKTDKS